MDLSPVELGHLVFGRVFDGADAALVLRRANGRVVAANARACELLGCAVEGVIGARGHEVIAGDAIDLIDPMPAATPASLMRGDGAEVRVALTVVHVDDVRVGALAAVRARPLSDAERARDADGAAAAGPTRRGAELRAIACEVAGFAATLESRAFAGEVVGRLAGPIGALESMMRGIAAAAGPVATVARAHRAVARLEACVAAIARAAGREPEPAPQWLDLGRELELAVALAGARHARAAPEIVVDIEPGSYGFVPRAVLHHVVGAALDAAIARGGCRLALATRDASWLVTVAGDGPLPLPPPCAFAAGGWGGEAAVADGRIEISVPVMIRR